MPPTKKRQVVPGSERVALPQQAKAAGAIDSEERIQITVLVRPRSERGAVRARERDMLEMSAQLPEDRQYMSREEFADQHGADPDDLAKIDAFAHDHDLTVVQVSIPRRTVKLEGTIAALSAAFKPNLQKYKIGNRVFRGRSGSLSVPSDISEIVVGVFGFDNRPAATPHFRTYDDMKPQAKAMPQPKVAGAKAGSSKKAGAKAGKKKLSGKDGKATPKNAPDGSFTPPQIAKLYNFPAGLTGKGQCIAIIELNDFDSQGRITSAGFSAADLKNYFQRLGIPLPQVSAIGVDGGANKPGGPTPNADGEVMLDIEVAGAVAPGAKLAVYFAPNTFQGFIDAVNAAIHDNVRKPSVVSISWGGAEDFSSAQFRTGMDRAFQDAATLGVTICCASGDDGSSDQRENRDGKPHADFPSSSPFALACGGTKLFGSGSTISSEVVWNEGNRGGAGGGGVSNVFPKPAYQAQSSVPKSPTGKVGRGVPDVAGDADPATGYQVRFDGRNTVLGGTSAVAPLWAGLIALINQRLTSLGKKPVGFINTLIYASTAAGAFHDIVQGNNDIDGSLGKYSARPGWDACTGLGTPDGTKVMRLLGG
jgi:kumamolisin